MKQINKNCLELIIIFVVSIIFWYMAMYYSQSISNYYNSISIRYDNEIISVYDIKQAIINDKKTGNNKISRITLWKLKKNEQIKTNITNRKIDVNIIQVYGNEFNSMPGDLLYGTYNLNKGYNECVIDNITAYNLFKDKNVTGNKIEWNDEQYLIIGIIKTDEKVMIINSNEKESFDNIEIIFQNSVNGTLDAENFIKENSFASPQAIIDFPFISNELIKLSLIPAIIIIIIFIKFIKFLSRVKQFPLLFIICFIMFLITFLFIIFIIKSEFQLSERFIPTKWSDFEFWINTYDNTIENIKKIMYIKPSPHEVVFNLLTVKYIVSTTISSLMIIISEKYILKLNWFELFLTEIIIVLINYFVIIKFINLNMIVNFSMMFWIIIPLYVFIRYMYDYINFSQKDDYY